jgi:hypothetical protein
MGAGKNKQPATRVIPIMSEMPVAELAACENELCSHCGAERKDASVPWCKKCGFHPQFNRVMELEDYDLETGDADQPEKKPTALDGLVIIVKKIPRWVWPVLMGVVVIALFSGAVRVYTEPFTITRVYWVVGQIIIGNIVLFSAHFWCYLYGVTESDKFSLMDVLIRPIAVWGPTVRDLKKGHNWWRVAMVVWGTLAELLAIWFIGGVPWEKVWEAGPKAPAKSKLLAAVADEARRGAQDADSLEDALGQVEGQGEGNEKKNKAILGRRINVDCVIIGYIPALKQGKKATDARNFSALILATELNGKLKFVGAVEKGIPVALRPELEARLSQIGRRTSFVPCSLEGNWVHPRMTCRISHNGWSKERLIMDTRFEQMLAEISMGK